MHKPPDSFYVIALDGPAASGKSTVAKLLAKKLDFTHVDSGAIYRTLTLAIMMQNIGICETHCEFGQKFNQAIQAKKIDLQSLSYSLKFIGVKQVNCLKGEDVGDNIRSPQVTERIRYIANNYFCREWVNDKLRDLGKKANIIVDGRDIGSVVFPQTPFKFFIEASVRVRSERRFAELQKMGHNSSLESIEAQVKKRDEEDRSRDFGALQQEPDAIRFDSSLDNAEGIAAKVAAYLQFQF